MNKTFCSVVLIAGMFGAAGNILAAQPTQVAAKATNGNTGFSDEELKHFSALEPIDTHTHIYKSDPAFFAMLKRLHMHTLDIVDVSDNGDPEREVLAKENDDVFGVVRDSDGHVSACTTFDAYRIGQPDFTAVSIHDVNAAFVRGAVAVKVWKNVGMEVKDAAGNYVLPDNPLLEPIYKDIVAHHKTLVTHVADPNTAWEPPDSGEPDAGYFINNPQWYAYKIPGIPSKAQILTARDHVLEMNPDLRMVGAHLGSMEGDFTQLAQHLDRYPNLAVDLAGRMYYLEARPRAEIIAFITKYQDRLIYGTDNTIYPQADVEKWVKRTEGSYAADWRFLATDDTVNLRDGKVVEGLALPDSIVKKIYHDNAVRWFPGILKK